MMQFVPALPAGPDAWARVHPTTRFEAVHALGCLARDPAVTQGPPVPTQDVWRVTAALAAAGRFDDQRLQTLRHLPGRGAAPVVHELQMSAACRLHQIRVVFSPPR